MATWFDRDRGVRSGRIIPSVVTPPDGDHVFVLGAEALSELAEVSGGDFTEVRQTVDLTGYDMLKATMDTIGTPMGQYQPKAGFDIDPDMLFGFDFNVGSGPSKNLVDGGFPMGMNGSIAVGKETYSPNGTYCRVIPVGAGAANMSGTNSPQAFPATLPEWTFQWWMNFDSSAYPVSTGVNPVVLDMSPSGTGGISVVLAGVVGLHKWEVLVKQYSGIVETATIGGFEIDSPQGWNLYTLRYKHSNSPPTQLELFVETLLAGQATTPFTVPPGQPLITQDVVYGNHELVGGLDDMRLISSRLSDLEVGLSWSGCVYNPAPIDHKWVMQISIDGRVYAERDIAAEERRRWTDFYAPVRLLTGPHDVAFRLKLETA
jgi:hypothetical protein